MAEHNMSSKIDRIPTDDEAYEKWLIKGLPDEWETVPKPSEALNNLQARIKEAHENCIKDMTTELALINMELETDIRLKSDALKQDLNSFKEMGLVCIPSLPAKTKVPIETVEKLLQCQF